jgi:hypothetical protein
MPVEDTANCASSSTGLSCFGLAFCAMGALDVLMSNINGWEKLNGGERQISKPRTEMGAEFFDCCSRSNWLAVLCLQTLSLVDIYFIFNLLSTSSFLNKPITNKKEVRSHGSVSHGPTTELGFLLTFK